MKTIAEHAYASRLRTFLAGLEHHSVVLSERGLEPSRDRLLPKVKELYDAVKKELEALDG